MTCHAMDFSVGTHSAQHIRRIVRIYLRQWDMPELTEAAELAVTELLANVVRHVPGRRCTLLIVRQDRGVRVEVGDPDPRPLVVRNPEQLDEGGRGLLLVQAVTDRWGVRPSPPGKTVWFECDAKTGT
ncbi:ATP-binding protein [Streptomyces kunmingensis]|uniref:ATP-binding protein n=1 Tax=Streptomyces kunmingensis TaxID=68225 RepID=A0ABU6CFM0_9ACTN|nr:ATP-binding protein [Streptomyces kunmingensis]MEB3963503.1 ATP-binding protein [Streptomyces kunmingensis]